jgi:hypothetical protein
MLANCANPLCSASLRRLAEGELFRLETEPALGLSKACRVEYFWLCHRCSSVMTLRLKEDGTVGAVLLLEAIRGVPARATLALAHRQKGLMLRGVSPHLPAHSAVSSQGGSSERLRAIRNEPVQLADLGRRVVSTEQMKETHRSRLHPSNRSQQP